ncbi:MAG: 3-dehydroquinate dehydratase [Bacteroidales bacterium]|nr:3-dehydroquinate dehydratase [Bacteroidales bacterium]
MTTIAIINGPNLNLTGRREPQIYGHATFDDLLLQLRSEFDGTTIEYYQSNVEGELVSAIQRYGFEAQGLVVNAGAYSHTSIALRDTLLAVTAPAIEVHMSNIFAREDYRHHSYLTSACRGMVCGLGMDGYRLAIRHLLAM